MDYRKSNQKTIAKRSRNLTCIRYRFWIDFGSILGRFWGPFWGPKSVPAEISRNFRSPAGSGPAPGVCPVAPGPLNPEIEPEIPEISGECPEILRNFRKSVPKLVPKWSQNRTKNGTKNRSRYRCWFWYVWDAILIDFWSQKRTKLNDNLNANYVELVLCWMCKK